MSEALKPILIAGAGLTGLKAALELSRLDVPLRFIDKQAAPATTFRAIGMQARTLELPKPQALHQTTDAVHPP